jgi:hypothetical protein
MSEQIIEEDQEGAQMLAALGGKVGGLAKQMYWRGTVTER